MRNAALSCAAAVSCTPARRSPLHRSLLLLLFMRFSVFLVLSPRVEGTLLLTILPSEAAAQNATTAPSAVETGSTSPPPHLDGTGTTNITGHSFETTTGSANNGTSTNNSTMSDGGNRTTSDNNTGDSSSDTAKPPLAVVRDVVLIFLAGAGIVVALMLGTYALTLVVDKARHFMGLDRTSPSSFPESPTPSIDTDDDSALRAAAAVPSRSTGGTLLLHDAGLSGISAEEFHRLLRHVLRPSTLDSFDDVGEGPKQPEASPENPVSDDAPVAPTTAAVGRDGSDSPDTVPTSGSSSSASSSSNNSSSSSSCSSGSDNDADEEEGCSRVSPRTERQMPLPEVRADAEERSPRTTRHGGDKVQTDDEIEVDLDEVDLEAAMAGAVPTRAGGDTLALGDADDNDHRRICCICLCPYEVGDALLRSRQCPHVYHYDCCLEWLDRNSGCPYCRSPLVTADELRTAAWEVLGPARVVELKHPPRHPRRDEHRSSSRRNHGTATITTTSSLPPLSDQRMFPSPRRDTTTTTTTTTTHRGSIVSSYHGGRIRTEPGAVDLIVVHL